MCALSRPFSLCGVFIWMFLFETWVEDKPYA